MTTYKTNVELVLRELDAIKSVTWNIHMDDSQRNARYDIIVGRDLLSGLQLDLCFYYYTIGGNGGTYEGCAVSMNYPSDLSNDARFRDE